jgi:shikimate dehydrogenase
MKLAVIGDPVEHSMSPQLHRGFFEETGLHGTYEAIRVPAGECAAAIERLRAEGYRGLNVTTPLKEEAFVACEHVDEIARRAQSVNTIVFEDGGPLLGCNTDGVGALGALAVALGKHDLPHGVDVLLLGVGPTARAAAYVLSRVGWARVSLWNRTPQSANALAEHLKLEVWNGQPVDAVFSALPPNAELDAAVRGALLAARVVIDANYGPRATLAAELGRPVHDGLDMLRASARASFDLWAEVERLARRETTS